METPGALSDLTVVEYAEGFAAPLCGKLLADLGACLVKVEDPAHPDITRFQGPFPQGRVNPEASALFLHLNTNKRGLALDLARPEGRSVLRDMVAQADVFLEGWAPGHVETLGLGWESVARLNPRLVMTSITPFGQDGPDSTQPASELTVWHAGGLGFIWRERDAEGNPGLPVIAAGHPASFQAAINAAAATVTALFAGGRRGRGQHVDISVQEVLASILAGAFPILAVEKRIVGRVSQASWIVPYGAKPCRDGEVLLSGREDEHWQRLVQAMGSPAWASEAWCKDPVQRSQNADLVDALMEEWRLGHTKDEIVRIAQAHRVPSSKVCTPEEVLADPHLAERGFFTIRDSGAAGPLPYIGAAYRLSETPATIRAPAPRLGQHSEEVLRDIGGYDAARVEALLRAGVVK
ncbi:MAG: CoA transferase [Chloroflexi bacterium]|nr:CoA transferase [Chloroflexota bacterium]